MSQTLLICDGTITVNPDNSISCDNWVSEPYDTTLADALTLHASALEANTSAMNEFFTLSAEDVGYISAMMLVLFIMGNGAGKIAQIMRKA